MSFQFRCPGGCLLEGDPAQAGSTIQCPICQQMFIVPAPLAAPAPQQPATQQPVQPQPAPQQPVQPQPAPQQPVQPQQMAQPLPQQPAPHMPQQPLAQQPAPQQPAQPTQPYAPQPAAQAQAPQVQHPPAAASPMAPTAQGQQAAAPAQASPTAAASEKPIKTSPAARILSESYRVLNFPCPCGQWVEAPRELAGQNATCPHCQQLFTLLETESREYLEAVEIARRRREARVGNAWLNWAIAFAVFVLIGLAALIIKSQLEN